MCVYKCVMYNDKLCAHPHQPPLQGKGHMYMCVCVCIYTYMCVCVYIYVYVYMYVSVWMYVHVYVCIYRSVSHIMKNSVHTLTNRRYKEKVTYECT